MRRTVKRQKEDRHSARARDERGVSIWTELRMRAGELLENAESVTERDTSFSKVSKNITITFYCSPVVLFSLGVCDSFFRCHVFSVLLPVVLFLQAQL